MTNQLIEEHGMNAIGYMVLAHAKNFTKGNIDQACTDIANNTQWTKQTLLNLTKEVTK